MDTRNPTQDELGRHLVGAVLRLGDGPALADVFSELEPGEVAGDWGQIYTAEWRCRRDGMGLDTITVGHHIDLLTGYFSERSQRLRAMLAEADREIPSGAHALDCARELRRRLGVTLAGSVPVGVLRLTE